MREPLGTIPRRGMLLEKKHVLPKVLRVSAEEIRGFGLDGLLTFYMFGTEK